MESNTSHPTSVEKLPSQGVIFTVSSLYAYLLRIHDPRKRRGIRYTLVTILVVFILAKLCGLDTPYAIADWAQNRSEFLADVLHLKRPRLPHHSTYRRILESGLDPDEFERLMSEFIQQCPTVGQAVVMVIDGKTLRGTITRDDPFGLHLLAAYLPGEGLVLLQMVVEQHKENEIKVAPQLLKSLDLRQKVVVADALHAQRDLSLQITQAGGDFVWIIKDNQLTTRQAIELLFTPQSPLPGEGRPPLDFQTARTFEKGHGRLEERILTVSSLLNEYLDWPGVAQVFKLERRFTNLATGEVEQEVRFGLTSLSSSRASPKRLMQIVRSEWGIENGLHYRRDVTFHEDATRMTHKAAGRAMATINNLVTNLLAIQAFSNFAQARRIFDAHPHQALSIILGL